MKCDPAALDRWRLFIDSTITEVEKECEDRVDANTRLALRLFGGNFGMRLVNPDAAERETGVCSIGDDPELFAEHLQTQAAMHSDVIEAAVIQWTENWSRPRFSGEAAFYFLFRLALAFHLLELIAAGSPMRTDLYGQPPDPNDRSRFLRWLLVQVWDTIGDAFLEEWADDDRKDLP